jgi:hypothetical protein
MIAFVEFQKLFCEIFQRRCFGFGSFGVRDIREGILPFFTLL